MPTLRTRHLLASLALGTSAHAATVTNGNFEDTSGTFPNGWTPSGTGVTIATGPAAINGNSASIGASSSLTGDFAATTADALSDFQLDFSFRMSNWNLSNTIQLLDGSGAAMIGVRFNASGNLSVLDGGAWRQPTATTGFVFQKNTTYHFRFVGTSFDTAARAYTFAYSTDGVNYTTLSLGNAGNTGFTNNGFASGSPGKLDGIKFTVGATPGFTLDDVTLIDNSVAIPEPSTYGLLGAGAAAAAAMIRRRRNRA